MWWQLTDVLSNKISLRLNFTFLQWITSNCLPPSPLSNHHHFQCGKTKRKRKTWTIKELSFFCRLFTRLFLKQMECWAFDKNVRRLSILSPCCLWTGSRIVRHSRDCSEINERKIIKWLFNFCLTFWIEVLLALFVLTIDMGGKK